MDFYTFLGCLHLKRKNCKCLESLDGKDFGKYSNLWEHLRNVGFITPMDNKKLEKLALKYFEAFYRNYGFGETTCGALLY